MDTFWTWPSHVLAPALALGLFVRALGLVHILAFASLAPQILGLIGSRGISPVKPQLDAARRDFPSWRRFFYFPTLFWINASDRTIVALIATGILAGASIVVGGPHTPFALLVALACYLAFDLPVGLVFPWDCLLFETTFLAAFCPPLRVLPELSTTVTPPVLVVFALQLLTFRVLFGFGKVKFWGSTRHDLTYLQAWVVNQPIPTHFAFILHRAPVRVLQAFIYAMFFGEVVAPFLIFLPGVPRVAAGVVIAGLMVGIQLVGNFGFFNVLAAVCCLPLLDARTLRDLAAPELFGSPFAMLRTAVVGALILGGILNLPLNNWSQSWFLWVSFERMRNPILRGIVALLRFFGPFRILNAYGVFPPSSGPALHWTPVFQGTADGETWEEYGYRYMPSQPDSRPCFVAPHHPRLDHYTIYEGYGAVAQPIQFALSADNPYTFARFRQARRIMQRLLENEPSVTRLFGKVPFSAERPAIKIRMRMLALSATTPEERRRTGHWWHRHEIGEHIAEVTRDDDAWDRWLPPPEMFHWDALVWWLRAPSLRKLWHEGATPIDACDLVRRTSPELAPAVDALFDDLLPIALRHGGDWARAGEVREELLRRFSPDEIAACERALRQLAFVLTARLFPHWQRAVQPVLDIDYYRLGLLAQFVVSRGREALDAVMKEPARAATYLAETSLEDMGFLTVLFNYDDAIMTARKYRIRDICLTPPDDDVVAFVSGSFIFQRSLHERFGQDDAENLPSVSRIVATGEWRTSFDNEP